MQLLLLQVEDLRHVYPPFINNIETIKELIAERDASNPRFHAFLMAHQQRPQSQRQSLIDLLIRPVQRLPTTQLLLSGAMLSLPCFAFKCIPSSAEMLRHTAIDNPDHARLTDALAQLKTVLWHINDTKRVRDEGLTLFETFNDIEGLPVRILI